MSDDPTAQFLEPIEQPAIEEVPPIEIPQGLVCASVDSGRIAVEFLMEHLRDDYRATFDACMKALIAAVDADLITSTHSEAELTAKGTIKLAEYQGTLGRSARNALVQTGIRMDQQRRDREKVLGATQKEVAKVNGAMDRLMALMAD